MKKLLCITLLIATPYFAFSQIQKGNYLLEGAISYAKTEFEDQLNTRFGTDLSFGYFISEKTSLNISLGYDSDKNDIPSLVDVSSNSFSYGLFSRTYFLISEKFYWSLEGFVSLSDGKQEDNSGIPVEVSRNDLTIGIRPALTYLLSKKFALNLHFGLLSYQHTTFDTPLGERNSDIWNLNFSTSSLGLSASIFL